MKKTLFIALLLIPFLGISQTTKPIDGFLGVKFGASKDDVIAAIKARGGNVNETPTNERVSFNNVKLGPRKAEELVIYFVNNKMYQGAFYFKPEQEPQTIEYYNALVSDISEVYGKGKPAMSFKSPYENGDGHELLALSSGNAKFYTNFNSDKNLLQIDIKALQNEELYVIASYYDNTLVAEAHAKEKDKAKSDY
jgi:hypothetical protein